MHSRNNIFSKKKNVLFFPAIRKMQKQQYKGLHPSNQKFQAGEKPFVKTPAQVPPEVLEGNRFDSQILNKTVGMKRTITHQQGNFWQMN
ncbi:MAG: hypothetical protein J6Y30_04665 [Treponema sp.]|nr:hypothetical protein [Treponema sp.]